MHMLGRVDIVVSILSGHFPPPHYTCTCISALEVYLSRILQASSTSRHDLGSVVVPNAVDDEIWILAGTGAGAGSTLILRCLDYGHC
jgi:hypothetical protein